MKSRERPTEVKGSGRKEKKGDTAPEMRRQFGAKNTDDACVAKFCPVNSSTGPAETVPANPQHVQIKKRATPAQYDPANADPVAQKLIPYDPEAVARNRALRRQMDLQRQQDEASLRNRYQTNIVVQGAPAATKIKLLLTLQKFKSIGIDYKMISQYFGDSVKQLPQTGDVAVISSFLVFEKVDLADSNGCYDAAIAGLNKTTTTNYAAFASVVDGLSEIITDLKL